MNKSSAIRRKYIELTPKMRIIDGRNRLLRTRFLSSFPQLQPPLAFDKFVKLHGPNLKPPVANKLLFGKDSFLKVMIVGGPNERKDYHLQVRLIV